MVQNHISDISYNTETEGQWQWKQGSTLHGGKWSFLLESVQIDFGPTHSPGRKVKQAFPAGLQ